MRPVGRCNGDDDNSDRDPFVGRSFGIQGWWLNGKRQMRLRRRGTDGLSTHRWREMDSNF
jgi:hypothetical protein